MSYNDEHLIGIFAPLLVIPLILGSARFQELKIVQFNAILSAIICFAVIYAAKGVWLIPIYPMNSKDVSQFLEVSISGLDPLIYTILLLFLLAALVIFRL